jgi:hypothetical protein
MTCKLDMAWEEFLLEIPPVDAVTRTSKAMVEIAS